MTEHKIEDIYDEIDLELEKLSIKESTVVDVRVPPSRINHLTLIPGRFQPFHRGHFYLWNKLISKFSRQNVHIITSNKIDPRKNSYFDFSEKLEIINKLYSIPTRNIHMSVIPYVPERCPWIVKYHKPYNTSVAIILSDKDASRLLGSTYYQRITLSEWEKYWPWLEGYDKKCYVVSIPGLNSELISATKFRSIFMTSMSEEKRIALFKEFTGGRFNQYVYNLIYDGLSYSIREWRKHFLSKKNNIMSAPSRLRNYLKENFIKNDLNKNIDKEWSWINELARNYYRESEIRYLTEGGAFGHLNHFWDDYTFTVKDTEELIDAGLSGNLSKTITEKIDGFNLMMSYKNGRWIYARNSSHIKDAGKNALKIDDVKQMWDNIPSVKEIFVNAITTLEKRLKSLSREEISTFFKNGKGWLNIEIVDIKTERMIPYSTNVLVFNNMSHYDDLGNVIDMDYSKGSAVAKLVKESGDATSDTFEIASNDFIHIKPSQNFTQDQSKFNGMLNTLKSKYNLAPGDSVIEGSMWKQCKDIIEQNLLTTGNSNNPDVIKMLVKRTVWGTTIPMKKIKETVNQEFYDWYSKWLKSDVPGLWEEVIDDWSELYVKLGTTILKNIGQFICSNQDDSIQKIKNLIDSAVDKLKSSGDPVQLKKVDTILNKIEKLGGMKEILPTEGIVFIYKNKLYKFTGVYGKINQLYGLWKFGKKQTADEGMVD